MKFENLICEIRDGIFWLVVNRPETRNALTPEMWEDIRSALQAAAEDGEVKLMIITGTGGKAFASGADIREIHDRETVKMLQGTATAALKQLEDLLKPTICAVNGYAIGGGCELAMACDIRIATKRSKFGQPETGLGIIPGAGGTQRLARLVGIGRAKELIFTGRLLTAEEAHAAGLVNLVTEDDEAALWKSAENMARMIIGKGPLAVSLAKLCINMGTETDMNTALMLERLAQTVVFATEDRKEGTGAFLEKRKPDFKGC